MKMNILGPGGWDPQSCLPELTHPLMGYHSVGVASVLLIGPISDEAYLPLFRLPDLQEAEWVDSSSHPLAGVARREGR